MTKETIFESLGDAFDWYYENASKYNMQWEFMESMLKELNVNEKQLINACEVACDDWDL